MSFYKFAQTVFKIYSKTFYGLEVVGKENIPTEGNLVIAANHKSNLDPIFVASAIEREVSVIAKKELFENKLLANILAKLKVISVDREDSSANLSTLKNAIRILRNGDVLGIFPEGTRVKGSDFGEAKAGLAMLAIKGRADVLPISIVSKYKLFKKTVIYIDKPISLEKYYKEKLTTEDYLNISNDIMEIIKNNYFFAEKEYIKTK
jgi:1-acyl-sn-glycerol-3-phosphate acyltransferase